MESTLIFHSDTDAAAAGAAAAASATAIVSTTKNGIKNKIKMELT